MLQEKTFYNVDLEKSAMKVILLSSKNQFERTTFTQNFQWVDPNTVILI